MQFKVFDIIYECRFIPNCARNNCDYKLSIFKQKWDSVFLFSWFFFLFRGLLVLPIAFGWAFPVRTCFQLLKRLSRMILCFHSLVFSLNLLITTLLLSPHMSAILIRCAFAIYLWINFISTFCTVWDWLVLSHWASWNFGMCIVSFEIKTTWWNVK